MTSIPANVQNYLGGNQAERPRVQGTEAKEDFSKVLDRQKTEPVKDSSSKTGETKKEVTDTEDVKTPEQTEKVQTETDKTADGQEQETSAADASRQPESDGAEKAAEQQPAAEKESGVTGIPAAEQPTEEWSEEELGEIMEVLQSTIQQIQSLLMQKLELSPQDLEQLMQDNGLTDADLLQPEVVDQLILDAAGEKDSLALVMDEGLYTRQQAITQEHQEITQDLSKQLGEQDGKLSKALESLQKTMSSQPVQEPAPAMESQSGSGRETGEKTDSRQQNQDGAGQLFFQNYTAQTSGQTAGQTVSVTAGMEATYLDSQDSQQVMNQILDYMKVSMKSENTVLDMQLHPESLGTLHVQISAREGVMTAHFTASSEAVKTVLENQLVALKESFLQQDIRVDAIEVTVETHQFESNLEQGRQRGGETEDRRSKRRRLDLSSLEQKEELTETEQILTDLMAANGNSVDYLA